MYQDSIAKTVLFDYQEGRGREGPSQILRNFEGYLQTVGYALPELGVKPEKMIESTHSHPGGINYPSGRPVGDESPRADVNIARVLESKNPKIKFNIYTPSDGKYTSYSGGTKAPDLEPVIITAPRRKK